MAPVIGKTRDNLRVIGGERGRVRQPRKISGDSRLKNIKVAELDHCEGRVHLEGIFVLRPERLVLQDQRRIPQDQVGGRLGHIVVTDDGSRGAAVERILDAKPGHGEVEDKKLRRKIGAYRVLPRPGDAHRHFREPRRVTNAGPLKQRLRERCVHLRRHLRGEAFQLVDIFQREIRHASGKTFSDHNEIRRVKLFLLGVQLERHHSG